MSGKQDRGGKIGYENKYRPLTVILLLLLVMGIWALVYQIGTFWGPPSPPSSAPPYGEGVYGRPGYYHGGDSMMRPGNFLSEPLKIDFESEGELIYYTGYNESGKLIEFEYGPGWLYMHGGSCVSCHGPDGRGGVPVMMVTTIPPDIRYEALSSEEHGAGHEEEYGEKHEEEYGGEQKEEHPPYTDESIKRAIREGLDPAGAPLDFTMPRWDMTESDMDELVGYLKTL